jgi:hypothetical protein
MCLSVQHKTKMEKFALIQFICEIIDILLCLCHHLMLFAWQHKANCLCFLPFYLLKCHFIISHILIHIPHAHPLSICVVYPKDYYCRLFMLRGVGSLIMFYYKNIIHCLLHLIIIMKAWFFSHFMNSSILIALMLSFFNKKP